MTIKEKIIFTLKEAFEELQELQDDFYLFGSAALVLKGVGVEHANDIDILVSKRDAEFLKEKWIARKQAVEQNNSNIFRSELSLFRFDLIDIEASADLEVSKDGSWQKLKILEYEQYPIGKGAIKIPTLQELKRILQLFGREKDLQRALLID